MKTNRTPIRTALLAATILLAAGAAAQLRADDHKPYDRDQTGYFDADHHHHPFVLHNGHHGYWDERSGTRIWISID